MRYRAVLIDADDTLFDFHGAEKRAIAQVLAFAGVTDPDAPAVYSQINQSYWRKLERGEVTTAFLRVARFRDFAERYGVNIDPEALADEFVRALSMQRELIPGALEMVSEIAAHMPVAIVTNGIAEVQHARFDQSPILRHVAHLVISGEVGFQKPDPRLLLHALNLLGMEAKDALLAGDGLQSDILAANRAGVDACWYNPQRQPRPAGAQIEYEIEDIRELVSIALAE